MKFGYRCFLFEADGTIRHLSLRVMDGLVRGSDALPQYAGQRLRLADVHLKTLEGKPSEIHEVRTMWLEFDDRGKVDQYLRETGRRRWEAGTAMNRIATDKSVVDVTPRIESRRLDEKTRWTPSPKDINRIIQVIWPEEAATPVTKAKPVQGLQMRKPSMTYEAKQAIGECQNALFAVARSFSDLSEPSLKAFIAEAAERAATSDPSEAPIWKGIASAAEHQLSVLKARRTKKGVWIAEATATIWRGNAGETSCLEHVQCKGRDAAVKAGRALLKKHADQFNDYTTVEVQIMPEIEWQSAKE